MDTQVTSEEEDKQAQTEKELTIKHLLLQIYLNK